VLSTVLALVVLTAVPHIVGQGDDSKRDLPASRDDNRNN
jgi:hypothetical protein